MYKGTHSRTRTAYTLLVTLSLNWGKHRKKNENKDTCLEIDLAAGAGLAGDDGRAVLGADQVQAGLGLVGAALGILELVLVSPHSLQVLHGHGLLKGN